MPNETPTKRKGISKKTRFEVFKRDSFTCQYCGRKAPDVVLHVDHIKPVAKGGKNSIMNYVTSCFECNLGKGARELSDSSAVEKSRKQAELLQERREQIKMLGDWHIQLADQREEEVEAVCNVFKALSLGKHVVSEKGRGFLRQVIADHGLEETLAALQEGSASYGDPITALDKIKGIIICRKNPHLRRRAYLAAIYKRKFKPYYDESNIVSVLEDGYRSMGDEFFDKVEKLLKSSECPLYWKSVINEIQDIVTGWD